MTTDPATEPLRFAYWVPNVSGGLVTSTIEQRTDWSFDYNRTLARLAERAGFDYALSQVRYTASYGAEYQHESTSFSLALLMATERLKLIAAVHPGLWHPGVLAKWVATADHLSGGRVAVNVVSGWFSGEFRQLGEPWLEHDERYRRTAEFILALKRIWTQDEANLAGDFYRIRDFSLKPKPLSWPGRPHPEIFQGGNSSAAQRNGGQRHDRVPRRVDPRRAVPRQPGHRGRRRRGRHLAELQGGAHRRVRGHSQNALDDAVEFIRTKARVWYESSAERAVDDLYTQLRVGEMKTAVDAAELLSLRAAELCDEAVAHLGDARIRGEASLVTGQARHAAAEAALFNGSYLFKVCGAGSVLEKYGFDRHWRNARTLSLHNPLDFKLLHAGDYLLNDTLPPVDSYN